MNTNTGKPRALVGLAIVTLLSTAVMPAAAAAADARETGVASVPKLEVAAVISPEALAAMMQPVRPTPGAAPLPAQLSSAPANMGPEMQLTVGKSTLLRLPDPVERMSIGNPAIADVTPISQREVYLLGKDLGTTNLIVWSKSGQATVMDVTVTADPKLLEAEFATLMPAEKEIRVKTTADSIVLLGTVSDALKVSQAVEIAQSWIRRLTRGLVMPVSAGGEQGRGATTIQVGDTRNTQLIARLAAPRVINMLRVRSPMQVMLEVKVAEVSKTLLSRLGVTTQLNKSSGSFTYDILSRSNFFNQLLGTASVVKGSQYALQLDAQNNDGLIRLLAEPNIMAISGQEASFRAGGKIFIPVGRRNDLTGGTIITLEEKEFGVGLKFKPMVLEGDRINLQVAPEVSELQQTGTPFTTVDGTTSVLPSFTLRRAETTVQLNDGQSFMIAGLIQNNTKQTINRFPGLGDVPILGALFRSTEFQADRTELMFVITPRLVKPLPEGYDLPTDFALAPTAADLYLNGKMERGQPADEATSAEAARVQPERGGFEVK